MSKKYPCIESTIDLTFDVKDRAQGPITIRLWLSQESIPTSYARESSLVRRIGKLVRSGVTRRSLLGALAQIKGVNAVQLVEPVAPGCKFGTVIYTVDFDDVRG